MLEHGCKWTGVRWTGGKSLNDAVTCREWKGTEQW